MNPNNGFLKYEDKYKEKNKSLNSRQRLFAEILVSEGWFKALEITQYSRASIWRLTRNPNFKEYVMSLFKESSKKLKIEYTKVIKELWDMARDENVPASVRNRILTKLQERIEEESDIEDRKQTSYSRGNFYDLKPSKEYYEDSE